MGNESILVSVFPLAFTVVDLFNEAEVAADPNAEEPTAETIVNGYIRKQEGEKRRRLLITSFMTSFHLDPDANICPQCGSIMERVGWEKVRTELEVIPAQIRLVNIYQERYRRTSISRSVASTSWQMGIKDTIICRRASSDVAA